MMQLVTTNEYDSDLKEHVNMASHALDLSKGVKSDTEYKQACDYLVAIRETRRKWEAKIDPSIKTAHQLHKQLNELKRDVAAPLVKAEEEILKPAILKWEHEQEEKRRVDQEVASRELKRIDEENRLNMAAELEKSGKREEATAVLEAPVQEVEVILPKTTEYKGIQYRTVYSAEVTDIKALCRAVADGHAPTEFIVPNMPVLNSLARNLKETIAPQWKNLGLKVKSEKTIAVGGR